MGIVSVKRTDKKMGSEKTNSRTLTDEYWVTTNSPNDEPSTIYDSNFNGIPQIGDPHPTDPLVTVIGRDVSPTKNRLKYLLKVSYSNEVSSDQGGGGGGGGGSIEALKVTVDSWTESIVLESDYSKTPKVFKDKAGSKLKYQQNIYHTMITITAQTKDPDFRGFQNLEGLVNSSPVRWLGLDFLRDQMLFKKYRASSIGNNTWAETFVFLGRKMPSLESVTVDEDRTAGWQPQILNAGLWELVEKGGEKKREPIKTVTKKGDKINNRPVTSPWPLDLEGVHIPLDDIDKDRVFLQFQTYFRSNFSLAFDFDFTKILTGDVQNQLGIQ